MNRDQNRLQVGGPALAQVCVGRFSRTDEFGLRPARDFHVKERLDFAKAANVFREMETQVGGETRAEEDVITKVIDTELEVAEGQGRFIAPEVGWGRRFRGSQTKDRELGHWHFCAEKVGDEGEGLEDRGSAYNLLKLRQ